MTEYVVKEIARKYPTSIELTLRKYVAPTPPKPVEPVPLPPDPLETVVPENDEEKTILKVLKAFRKFGLFPRPVARAVPGRLCYAPTESKLSLTNDEYKELGKPGLGQRIDIALKKVQE